MTVAAKNKPPVIVPPAALRRAGFRNGEDLEFRASGGVITIVPKLPSAEDEYTAEQRRGIDAELDEAEKVAFHGPFSTADQMIAHIKRELKKKAAPKKSKRSVISRSSK